MATATRERGDEWGDFVAEQEALAEVEAELRERAPDLTDAALARLGRALLDHARLPDGLVLEFRDPRLRLVTRRVTVPPAGG